MAAEGAGGGSGGPVAVGADHFPAFGREVEDIG